MGEYQEFCREWDKSEVEMEVELFKTLKAIHDKKNIVILNDGRLYFAKINYLVANGFIYREYPKNRTTSKGDNAIARGWVEINIEKYKKQKRKELREKITPNLLQGISIIVAIILGIYGFISQRECSSESASEIKNVIPNIEKNVIDTTTKINEVSQACDSTSKKDSIKSE